MKPHHRHDAADPRGDSEVRDAALLERIAVQDRDAFEALYHRYYRRLFSFVYRITHRVDIAEEILNDVMLLIWQKASSYEGRALVSSWIFGIAYKRSLKALRQIRTRAERSARECDELEATGNGDMESAEQQRAELRDLLAHGLDRLSPEQRAVVELTYYFGYKYTEIAAITDCPVNTVKTRMFHARRQLRAILGELSGVQGNRFSEEPQP